MRRTKILSQGGLTYDESIRGTRGDDVIDGGDGADIMRGGAGHDTFVFHRGDSPADGLPDLILDFNPQRDTILFDGVSPREVSILHVEDGVLLRYGTIGTAGDPALISQVHLPGVSHTADLHILFA